MISFINRCHRSLRLFSRDLFKLGGESAFSDIPGFPQLFDSEWYRKRYPDVAASHWDPVEHYQRYGIAEQRDPHPLFNSRWYSSRYLQSPGADPVPIVHYLLEGVKAGYDPHPRFDTEWYLSRNSDIDIGHQIPLLHYVERHGSDPRGLIRSIRDRITDLRSNPDSFPLPGRLTDEAGIVISASGKLMKPLYANLRNIRDQGCTLPIDIWHLPGEFTAKQQSALSHLASFVEAHDTPFGHLSGQHEVHGFKAWMLLKSRFERTLMLDVNSFPLNDLGPIFHTDHNSVLWRDGPWNTYLEGVSELRTALGISLYPHEFESGQLYVNKSSVGVQRVLRLVAALNTLGRRLYAYTYGDKETYAIAFDLLSEPFTLAPEPQVSLSQASRAVDGGLVHQWLDGSPVFYHPLGDKEQWWHFKDEWRALKKEARKVEESCR